MAFSNSTDMMDSDVVTAGGVGDGPSSLREGLKMLKGAKNFMDAYAFNVAQRQNYPVS
jgi:catalase